MSRLVLVLIGSYSLACGFALAAQPGTPPGTPPGAPVASANVHIESVTGSIKKDSFTCTVSVNNNNDDDSQNTKVIVLLPLQVEKILGITINRSQADKDCTEGSSGGFVGNVTCQLGSLGTVGPPRIVEITTSPSTALPGYAETCSAFVYSSVGDIKKHNNYCYWPDGQTLCAQQNQQ